MLEDLIDRVNRSRVPELRLSIEVTCGSVEMSLHDRNGQRGSKLVGGPDSSAPEWRTLDGLARGVVLQELERALKTMDG